MDAQVVEVLTWPQAFQNVCMTIIGLVVFYFFLRIL